MKLVISDNERQLDLINDANIRLLQEGLDMPIPAREMTYAESADSDGRRRVRSRSQNAEGRISVHIQSTTEADFWDNVDDLIELVESTHRNKGTIVYQPPGGTEMTLDVESMTVTGLPQRGIELNRQRTEVEITFEVKPYGKLASTQIGGYLELAETYGPSILLALDATNKGTDLSGNGRNGTAAGGLTLGGFASGPYVADNDGATDFDGSDDRVTTTYSTRRNLAVNPRAAVDTSGLTNGGLTTMERITAVPTSNGLPSGFPTTGCFRFVGNSSGDRADWSVPVVSGRTYTFSFYARIASESGGAGIRARVVNAASSGKAFSPTTTTVGGAFQRISVTVTADATETWQFSAQHSGGTDLEYHVTGVLIEESGSVGTYFDGSGRVTDSDAWITDPGSVGWLGTAHNSASDFGCFANGTTRTFTGWAYRDSDSTVDALFSGTGTDQPYLLQSTSSNNLTFKAAFSVVTGVTFSSAWPGNNQWVHWALVFDEPSASNNISLYINGTLHSTATHSTQYGNPVESGNFQLGRNGAGNHYDGKMSGVGVYERGLSAEEIHQLYAVGKSQWTLNGPIDYVTSVEVPGQAVAFGDLELTEASTQTRDFVEIGVQADFDPTNPEPLLLTAGTMSGAGGTLTVVTGTAGTASRPTGAYTTSGGNSYTIRTGLSTTPTACATTSTRTHKGLWKIRARVQPSATNVRVRLAWRIGDAPWTRESWKIINNEDAWYDLDLGTIDIPTLSGTHKFEARVEAASDSGYPNLDIDTVSLIPADRYLKLRGRQVSETTSGLIAADDFESHTPGTLTGKAPPITAGGNWTGSGATTDFNVVAGGFVERTSSNDTTNGRFMRAGTSVATAIDARVDVTLLSGVPINRGGVVARYVDLNNFILLMIETGTSLFRLIKRVSGVDTTLARNYWSVTNSTQRWCLRVETNGSISVQTGSPGASDLTTIGTYAGDADTQTGGALDDGGYGIFHQNGYSTNVTARFDNFTATVPSATSTVNQPVVFSNRKLEVTNEAALTASSDGAYLANTPVREGNYLLLPPATRNGQKSRIVVRARRDDIEEQFADTGLTDNLTATLSVTPRVLLK